MRRQQAQRAGENSQQVQVSGDLVIHQGITEARAVEIAQQVARAEMAKLSAEADALGSERISRFDDRLVAEFATLDKLGAFGDPAFQILLRKAQLGAASTDRESDYDLLAKLLADRVQRGEDRHVRLGLDRAVQVVDQIDESALVGLTLLQAAQQFSPTSPRVDAGLDALDSLFAQLVTSELPRGSEWLDHLDILGAIRISQIGGLKDFSAYYPSHFTGYVSAGLEAGSEHEARVLGELAAASVDLPVIDHELRPGYRRLAFSRLENFETALANSQLSPEKKDLARRVAAEDYKIDQIEPSLVEPLMARLEQRPSLKILKDWWDEIPSGLNVTSVGRVLATANAVRCDAKGLLPPLD